MFNLRKTRAFFVVLFLVAMAAAICLFVKYERSFCMGAQIVSPDYFDGYSETYEFDITKLTFNNEMVAADVAKNTVYISQSSDVLTEGYALEGHLHSTGGQTLYFVEDENFTDIETTVKEGKTLSLYMVYDKYYQKVNVVVTTLPVLRLDGEVTHKDERSREVLKGDLTLWSGFDPASESYTVQSCNVEWHMRGQTTALLSKKSWKLSLKDKRGGNYDADFLGGGADDDWILNSLSMDDTKARERIAMELWQLLDKAGSEYDMSYGQYVEVVLNGEYYGLYMLQRRIDEKYLELDRNKDILLKGYPLWTANSANEAYEIVYSPYDTDETYEILSGMVKNGSFFEVSLDNFIDVNILVNYLVASDNKGYKNMFYVLRDTGDGYEVSLLPWDTDTAFGITWIDNFAYDYDISMNKIVQRYEYPTMQEKYSDLDELVAARWKELRSTVYTEEVIKGIIDESLSFVNESGAFKRDTAKWFNYYYGKDSHENLYKFCIERLSVLDEYYGNN